MLESGVKEIKTSSGNPCHILQKGERIELRNADREGFDLGDFVRDSVIGSRKAMGSGPALVPVGVSDLIIDRVCGQSFSLPPGSIMHRR